MIPYFDLIYLRTANGLIEPFPWAYYDFNWIVTLIISTGWMIHVANIPERPPITNGWIESKNLSVDDLVAVIWFYQVLYYYKVSLMTSMQTVNFN